MNIVEYSKKEALRIVGVPVLASELDDAGFLDEVISPAVYEYYIYAPYEYAYEQRVSRKGNSTISVPDLPSVISNWPADVTAEHVGLTGFHFSNGPPGAQDAGSSNQGMAMDSVINAQMDATIRDQLQPDEMFYFDAVANQYNVFTPGAGKLGMTFGYRLGHATDITIAAGYIRKSHAIAFSKIVVKKFLELLIGARSTVVVSSDVTLDQTALLEKLALINEKFEEDMSNIAVPFMTWG